jgi:hypothetical protein
MRRSPGTTILLLSCAITIAGGCRGPRTLTAEAASERGDELLRQMSKTLQATQVFSYTADQRRERVRANGEKVEERFMRDVIVRRPNAIAFVDREGRDAAAWYDGTHVTFVSHKQKVWARGPMPPTIDEAMDYVSSEYAVQIQADILYSVPYDALMTKDTKGRVVVF